MKMKKIIVKLDIIQDLKEIFEGEKLRTQRDDMRPGFLGVYDGERNLAEFQQHIYWIEVNDKFPVTSVLETLLLVESIIDNIVKGTEVKLGEITNVIQVPLIQVLLRDYEKTKRTPSDHGGGDTE